MNETHFRLIAARNEAVRLLSQMPPPSPLRDALTELVDACDDAAIMEYPINPDFPDEGMSQRLELIS